MSDFPLSEAPVYPLKIAVTGAAGDAAGAEVIAALSAIRAIVGGAVCEGAFWIEGPPPRWLEDEARAVGFGIASWGPEGSGDGRELTGPAAWRGLRQLVGDDPDVLITVDDEAGVATHVYDRFAARVPLEDEAAALILRNRWQGLAEIAATGRAGGSNPARAEGADRGGRAMRPVSWFTWIRPVVEKMILLGWRPSAGSAGSQPPLPPEYERHDRLALRYGSVFRAAGIWRFLLPLIATLGLFVGSFAAQPAVRMAGFGVDILACGLVLLLAWSVRRGKWAERYAMHRRAAEAYRFIDCFAQLGVARMLTRARDAKEDWRLGQALRAVSRRRLLAHNRIDTEAARADLFAQLEGQIAYHRAAAARTRTLSERFERLGTITFAVGLVLSTSRFGEYLVSEFVPGLGGLTGRPQRLLDQAALILPALATTLYALKDRSSYERLRRHHQSVITDLGEILVRLRRAAPWSHDETMAMDDLAALLHADLKEWRSAVPDMAITYF